MKRTTSSFSFWLIFGVACVAAAIGISQHYNLIKPAQQTTSSKPTASSSWQKITSNRAIFTTETFLSREKTFIYIPLKFESTPQYVVLGFDSQSTTTPSQYLVTHSSLSQLSDWHQLSQGVIHLYQKNKTYASIESFLSNPPSASEVLIDSHLLELEPYQSLKATPITPDTTLDDATYVFTTFINPPIETDYYSYQNTIDASSAILGTDEVIGWQLFAPEASETNAFFLGEIHIDYHRNAN